LPAADYKFPVATTYSPSGPLRGARLVLLGQDDPLFVDGVDTGQVLDHLVGSANGPLQWLGIPPLGLEPPQWFGRDAGRWGPPAFAISILIPPLKLPAFAIIILIRDGLGALNVALLLEAR